MKKNDDRFITAIFCDDIRQEIGNKLSFMGCYQGELVVEKAPIVLSKFCVFLSIFTPKKRPLKSLVFRIVQGVDIELARMEIPGKDLTGTRLNIDQTATRIIINTAIVFSPFVIEKSTMLRIMAATEEGEITGPRFLIKVATAHEPVAQPAKKSKTTKPRTIK